MSPLDLVQVRIQVDRPSLSFDASLLFLRSRSSNDDRLQAKHIILKVIY